MKTATSERWGWPLSQGLQSEIKRSSLKTDAHPDSLSGWGSSGFVLHQSGRPDSNRGPPAPKAGALPSCATPRKLFRYNQLHCFIEVDKIQTVPITVAFSDLGAIDVMTTR